MSFKSTVLKYRKPIFILLDILAVFFSMFAAAFISGNFSISHDTVIAILCYSPINIIFTVLLFFSFRLYSGILSLVSATEFFASAIACFVSSALMLSVSLFTDLLTGNDVFLIKNAAYYTLFFFFQLTCTLVLRFFHRFFRNLKKKSKKNSLPRVMVIGAGSAASGLLKEINTSVNHSKNIVCFIDDNPQKVGKSLAGIPIVGTRQSIPEMAEKYRVKEILVAIPSMPKTELKELLEICKKTSCVLKVVPAIHRLSNGDLLTGQIRDVQIEDLLGRDTVRPDIEKIIGYIQDKTVMVTGGGGSIGSELCRQIASHSPKRLIIVDIYENNAYDIQQELRRKHPDLDLVVLIASVRNTARINRIFDEYRPNIVYHAAAHKHVPLMETSPNEAVKNNVFGTLKTVQAADKYGVERLVMISTDKAVNPTNVMGATKRICEMIIQTYNKRSKTEFVAVRFGNVLGSNGSVIPLFKKQIAEGGPVLVTHPEIIRYFMTIPEAVSLVLSAGAYAKGGEIFVLDMGKPVKILDLATNLIRLSGYTPGVDIKIEFTGLRPGEKLYEELLMEEEGLGKTENELIHIGKPIPLDEDVFLKQLDSLYKAALSEPKNVRALISQIVPTYTGDPSLKNT